MQVNTLKNTIRTEGALTIGPRSAASQLEGGSIQDVPSYGRALPAAEIHTRESGQPCRVVGVEAGKGPLGRRKERAIRVVAAGGSTRNSSN